MENDPRLEIDPEYIKERNEFIPTAVRYADSMLKDPKQIADIFINMSFFKKLEDDSGRWNYLYHSKMQNLWETRFSSIQ